MKTNNHSRGNQHHNQFQKGGVIKCEDAAAKRQECRVKWEVQKKQPVSTALSCKKLAGPAQPGRLVCTPESRLI